MGIAKLRRLDDSFSQIFSHTSLNTVETKAVLCIVEIMFKMDGLGQSDRSTEVQLNGQSGRSSIKLDTQKEKTWTEGRSR